MSINHVISGLSIIVTGSFSPAIIQPDWLIKNKIEDPVEDDLIDTRYLTQGISEFSISGINYQTSLETLKIETEIQPFNRVIDKLAKVAKLLVHTPTKSINLIRFDHIRVRDKVHRTEIFRKFAPIQLGGDFGKGEDENHTESSVNLHTMTFSEDLQKDSISLTRFVSIEPSLNKAISNDGIYIGVQLLYDQLAAESNFCENVQIVKDEFETRVAEAKSIISTIQELA